MTPVHFRPPVLLLGACLLAAGGRADDPVRYLREIEAAVRAEFGALGIREEDLRPGHDYLPSDGHRLPLIDEWLGAPLRVPQSCHELFSPWVFPDESLSDSLERAARTLGRNPPPPGRAPKRKTLAGVLRDLLRPVPEERALARDLAVIPAAAGPFLAELLSAVVAAADDRREAFRRLSEDEWIELRKFGSQFNTGMPPQEQASFLARLHSRIDLPLLHRGAIRVARVLDSLPSLKRELDRGRHRGEFHLVFETVLGRVEIGGSGKDVYRDDALLIVDFGGDDTHSHSAGGTLYTPARVSVCVDLGGDDTYETKVGFAQGSGVYGIGLLVDAEGNDRYVSRNVSQGSGHAGVGVLWDLSGDDRYEAASVSQGAGFQGVGLLRDDAGSDTYHVGWMGQGFGTTEGFGILQDRKGDDAYEAGGLQPDTGRHPDRFLSLSQGFGNGNRAGDLRFCTSGGIGLLADAEGNDRYVADVFGQGAGYWYAIGVLLDGRGDDSYRVFDYGIGGGFHMAVGVLMDYAGNDRYVGEGHPIAHSLDRSVAVLVDHAGDDLYDGGRNESIGAAVKPHAFALFADVRGNDTYRDGMPGHVREPEKDRESQWPKAFFLDLAGRDTYAPAEAGEGDGLRWIRNRYGRGIDR